VSTKYVYICDHCGAECTDKFEFSLFGDWRRGNTIPDNVHGCTRDHTILAVAKIVGIGADGKAVELLTLANKRIAALVDEVAKLTKQRDEEHGLAQLRAIEIDTWKKELGEARERIAELESRPDAAEVLQRVRDKLAHEDDPSGHFRGILDAEIDSLTGPKKPTKPVVDHVHELGSCTRCDASKPQACMDCGGTGLLLSGQQCSDCRGKGYL
jgi:hypothetical protein